VIIEFPDRPPLPQEGRRADDHETETTQFFSGFASQVVLMKNDPPVFLEGQ
jgi:hypothetical protein